MQVSNRKTDSDLREIFSKYGNIISINVRRNDKHKKLYAFVVFSQPGEAAEAVEKYSLPYLVSTTHTLVMSESKWSISARRDSPVKNGTENSAKRAETWGK